MPVGRLVDGNVINRRENRIFLRKMTFLLEIKNAS